LRGSGVEVAVFPTDISRSENIAPLVSQVLAHFGSIDILVNDAGLIKVAPLDNLSHADFEEAMNLMFWAPVNLTLAVLPHMKSQGGGHVVNITSVGGRVSVPHLLPYSCAKFAFVGFSTGLSTELSLEKIHVLTVVPGLMRTGSYLNALFKGSAKREFAWFGLLANLPGVSVAAGDAAREIREALLKRQLSCTIGFPAKLLIHAEALLPETTRSMMQIANQLVLPSPGTQGATAGKEMNPKFNALFQALTSLGRLAASSYNE
jgi:short-subunit dehydrogenase